MSLLWLFLFIIILSQSIVTTNAFYQENVTCDSKIIGQTNGASDIDYYLFIHDNTNTTIFIDLCSTLNGTNFDTILNIYDKEWNLLSSNDTGNGCNNKQSQILFEPLTNDNFIIGVTGSNLEYGQYQMDITCMRSNTTSNTPNSTDYYTTIQPTTSPTLPPLPVNIKKYIECGDIIDNTTSLGDDPHYYAFNNIYLNNTITIDLCQSDFDTILYLRDKNETQLDVSNDDCGSINGWQSRINDYGPLLIDVYIIEITGLGGYGSYHLELQCDHPTQIQTPAPSTSIPIFAVDIKDYIDCGELIIDSTDNDDNPHYYAFHNKYENNYIIIDLCDSKYDTRTFLYSQDMIQLKENDDGDKSTECGPGSLQSYIDAGKLSSNFYIIEVNGYESFNNIETGTYHLIITCSITSSPTAVTIAPSPAPSTVTLSPTTAEPSISPTNQPSQSPTSETAAPSFAPTGVTSTPTTASPTKTPATLIFYDNMKYDTEWEISSSYHVEEWSSSTRCPIEPDTDCLRINGYSTGGCYIKRSVPNLDLFNWYQIKFVVTLSNYETADVCKVKYSWDDDIYFELNSYYGDGNVASMLDQSFIFPTNPNASTLYIMFENEGNSPTGKDYCYIDDVFLYGSPVEIDLEINTDFYDTLQGHIGCKDVIQGETDSTDFSHYYEYNNTINDTMIIINACGESDFHVDIFVAVWDEFGRRIATKRDPCGYGRNGNDPDGFYVPLYQEGIIIIQVYGYDDAFGRYVLIQCI